MENKTNLQKVFENVTMACNEKIQVEFGFAYKCILRYEGRQLTIWHTVPIDHTNPQNKQSFNKLDVIYSAWEDFATCHVCKDVFEYAKRKNLRDIDYATLKFKNIQKRSKGFQRLFEERVINLFLNRERGSVVNG